MLEVAFEHSLDTAQGRATLDVAFAANAGEVVAIVGPSGAGKSTTLRIIAGLLVPDRGHIAFKGTVWQDSPKGRADGIRPRKRGIGYVMQPPVLFEHLTVQQQLAFTVGSRATPAERIETLEALGLTALQSQRIRWLSGGQRQRVALAEALLAKPQLLLLDEPLSAVDQAWQARIWPWLKAHPHLAHCVTLLVSHNLDAIRQLGHRVLSLTFGTQCQAHTPTENPPESGFEAFITAIKRQAHGATIDLQAQGKTIQVTISMAAASTMHVGDSVSLKALFEGSKRPPLAS